MEMIYSHTFQKSLFLWLFCLEKHSSKEPKGIGRNLSMKIYISLYSRGCADGHMEARGQLPLVASPFLVCRFQALIDLTPNPILIDKKWQITSDLGKISVLYTRNYNSHGVIKPIQYCTGLCLFHA